MATATLGSLRAVAQSGSALRSGRRGRWFKSSQPDWRPPLASPGRPKFVRFVRRCGAGGCDAFVLAWDKATKGRTQGFSTAELPAGPGPHSHPAPSGRAARLEPTLMRAGGGPESALVGGVPDSIVDDAAGNQERLLRALNLESLFGGVVRPFQREASFGRLPAIRSDANPVLPAYHVLCARPLRGVDAGIGQWVTGHAPAESTKTRRLGPPSGLGWPSGTP